MNMVKHQKELGLFKKINDHIIQPLLTVSTLKVIKIKELLIFTFTADIGLKCFREMSYWVINDWCPYKKCTN